MTANGSGWPTHPKRKVTEVNCAEAPGDYLEEVPEISPGFRPGVILISSEWPDMYKMRKHELWGEAEYFEFAENRIKELHLKASKEGTSN